MRALQPCLPALLYTQTEPSMSPLGALTPKHVTGMGVLLWCEIEHVPLTPLQVLRG